MEHFLSMSSAGLSSVYVLVGCLLTVLFSGDSDSAYDEVRQEHTETENFVSIFFLEFESIRSLKHFIKLIVPCISLCHHL